MRLHFLHARPSKSGGRASGAAIKWYRRISVKLALGLGLAMFAIQLLASSLIIEAYRSQIAEFVGDPPARPFATYLGDHLQASDDGVWSPTPEAARVLETFLGPGESYLWLDDSNTVIQVGNRAKEIVQVGEDWPLCDSPEYCEVTFYPHGKEVRAGSSWSRMAIGGRPIGTFVLLWFDDADTMNLVRRQGQLDLFFKLLASGLIAALTSLLLVGLVTHRLSKLATDASVPVGEEVGAVDLPGPFQVSGDDEIARLASALNTMRGRIQELVARIGERDRQRREWIAQVSHDLRTPLTALVACLDRLRERVVSNDSPADRAALLDALNVARQDGQRLQTLVDDLFELARLDANEALVLEPVPPGELVRQTVRGLRPLAEARGITLVARPAPALPTIRADGRRLMRALENMVRNAIYFARTRVELVATCDEDDLRFEVLDDGPGLPLRDGKVVLGQSDDQPRRPDSAGLGLVVTRRVAAAHGGALQGANRPEGGARVWIRIPAVGAE